jgi:hypothetical protein
MKITSHIATREDALRAAQLFEHLAEGLPTAAELFAPLNSLPPAAPGSENTVAGPEAEPVAVLQKRHRRTKAEMEAARAAAASVPTQAPEPPPAPVHTETVEPQPQDTLLRDEALAQVRDIARREGHIWLRTILTTHNAANLSALPDDALHTILAAEALK